MQLQFKKLPNEKKFLETLRRAPKRENHFTLADKALALSNALRYIPKEFQREMKTEFEKELASTGRIYGYRFRPEGDLKAKPIDQYEGACIEGQAFQVMLDNNLSFEIALYPYELVTYGETGQVCQNWMQYLLIKEYLKKLTRNQTLVILSGHPLGLFPSHEAAPRVVITNAMMVGLFDNLKDWQRAQALGVANYGQMTAGGWMYIGPQGIVHGTYNTLLIAGRKKLGVSGNGNLAGKLFVSSGLGGMSGAQGKAMEIAGGVALIAEMDFSRIQTRFSQGWVKEVVTQPQKAFEKAQEAVQARQAHSIAFHGNIVDLLEYAEQEEVTIDLLSDQTSCHAVYEGGYCPQGISFEERTLLLQKDQKKFIEKVNETLHTHFQVIKKLVARGTYFFDYGNSFMKAVFDAGVLEISKNGINEKDGFIFPSYVEDILGPELFDYGYGPFRWVCLSGKAEDLQLTDKAAQDCILKLRAPLRYQDEDNYRWVSEAQKNKLVVGTFARILYQDAMGRVQIALQFNKMVREKKVGPIMLGRDHHDTGGTDSPFRETSNIKDGSNIMADMAVQSFAGNAARGMSLVALHNGGGVGIGKSINGGFGLVLDGSERVDTIIQSALLWDVSVGVARRAWAQNKNAITAISELTSQGIDPTIPY